MKVYFVNCWDKKTGAEFTTNIVKFEAGEGKWLENPDDEYATKLAEYGLTDEGVHFYLNESEDFTHATFDTDEFTYLLLDEVLPISTRDWVENLREDVRKGYYYHKGGAEELDKLCKEHDVDMFEDIIFPIEDNVCDRCGAVDWTENLCWIDYMSEESEADKKVWEELSKEHIDPACICGECYHELWHRGEE